LPKGTIKSI